MNKTAAIMLALPVMGGLLACAKSEPPPPPPVAPSGTPSGELDPARAWLPVSPSS